MNLKSYDIVVFTDGSSRGNPGPGGFAAIVVYRDDSLIHADKTRINADSTEVHIREIGGREEHTTNNRMELRAAIEALSFVSNLKLKTTNIKLFTDSAYLVNGITKWVYSWERRNWVTMDKKPVLNKDLWEQLAELTQNYAERTQNKIKWRLIGGHIGVAGNQRCDEIATAFADNLPPKLYADVLKNYSIENIFDITPSVQNPNNFSKRKLERARAYSYVSLVDGKIAVHKTWAECEKRVKGKRGARYKKVFSSEEEQKLVAQWSAGNGV